MDWTIDGQPVLVSTTAESHGYGCAKYKWVSRLLPEERAHVRSGGAVFYLDDRLSGGKSGHYLRRVTHFRGHYGRRVATPDELRAFQNATAVLLSILYGEFPGGDFTVWLEARAEEEETRK